MVVVEVEVVVVVVVTVVESVQHRASGSAVAAVGNMRSFWGEMSWNRSRSSLGVWVW